MRARAEIAWVLFAGIAFACRSEPTPRRADPAPVPVPAPAQSVAVPEGPPASASLVRCGWGGVSTEPGTEPPPWVIALLDVEARRNVTGLRVLAAELQAGEDAVATMAESSSIRVHDHGDETSFGAGATEELAGPLHSGKRRLRVAALLNGTLKSISAHKPTRCRVVLTDENGDNAVAEGPLEPAWKLE
jgi:hypothetical protein